jgi:hypothetical protein
VASSKLLAMPLHLIAETGFDRGKSPIGLLFIVVVTVALLLFIFAGGMFMRHQELEARRRQRDAENATSQDESQP